MKRNPNDAEFYRMAFLAILAAQLPHLLLALFVPTAHPMLAMALILTPGGLAMLIQWRRCAAAKEQIRAEGERRHGWIAGRRFVRFGKGVYYSYVIACTDGSRYETGMMCTNWNRKLRTLEAEIYTSGESTAVYVQRKNLLEKGEIIALIESEKSK